MFPIEIERYIFSYIDNINCCKLSSLFNYKCCNRFYKNIIEHSQLITNHKFYIFDNNILNVQKLCTNCSNFTDYELQELKRVENEFKLFRIHGLY